MGGELSRITWITIGRHVEFDLVEELEELLARCRWKHWPMTVPASTSSAANRVVSRGACSRGSAAGLAGPQRQARLGAVERLDLMGWMAPSRHRRAKVVAVEQHHQGEPSR